MKKLLILLLLIPMVSFGECLNKDIQTKELRIKRLNHFLNNLDKDFTSKVLVPPIDFMNKHSGLNSDCLSQPLYCFAAEIHNTNKEIKKIANGDDKEAIKYFKINNKLFNIKDSLLEYVKLDRSSNIKEFDIGYVFTLWTKSLEYMAECSL